MAGWLVAGMAWPGRWSGNVGTAGSLCDGEANDGKRLNDDYIQWINHNYNCMMLNQGSSNVCRGIWRPS